MGTESGETTAGSWKWFDLMQEAIGGRPSIQPPILIASASNSTTPPSSSTDPLERGDSEATPLPAKRQRRDPVLEFLEKESERSMARERRSEEREEKRINLLERIVNKM